MNLDFQITEYPEWRENKNKYNLGFEEIDKTSDMNNKLHVSTYIKTISEETNQHPNEKHKAKTNSTNITLQVLNLRTLLSIHIR